MLEYIFLGSSSIIIIGSTIAFVLYILDCIIYNILKRRPKYNKLTGRIIDMFFIVLIIIIYLILMNIANKLIGEI